MWFVNCAVHLNTVCASLTAELQSPIILFLSESAELEDFEPLNRESVCCVLEVRRLGMSDVAASLPA
ncbi:MAG: hypothetical protein CMJ72_05545 [Planctomycetaceae bacterium]|nr:hypothetical protein [Planctomycetaceae bacterium]HCK41001.1 hypothetical protein [Planctomycetaceae bacterium]